MIEKLKWTSPVTIKAWEISLLWTLVWINLILSSISIFCVWFVMTRLGM